MAYLHLQIIPEHNIIRYSLQDKPFIKFQQFGCHSQQCESIFTFIYIHVVTGSSSTLFEYKRICFTLQSHHQCSFHYQCHWLPSSLSWTWLFIDNTGSSQYRLSVLSDLHAYDMSVTTLALAGAARPPLLLDRASRPNARRLSPAPLLVAISVFRRTHVPPHLSAAVASLADLVSPAFRPRIVVSG